MGVESFQESVPEFFLGREVDGKKSVIRAAKGKGLRVFDPSQAVGNDA